MRVSGQFASEESLRAINLRVNDRFFRLSDVATISRGYKDPPDPLFRIDGQPAIGLGIAMTASGNLLQFGEALKAKMREIEGTLPVGVGVHLVSDQPKVVDEAVKGFVKALVEAVVIVLAVSFLSLGVRAGLVVSVSIPLVLAVTFVVMEIEGISLQRISLGALIIALGLLVDDAMITVEMMVSRLEVGEKLENAATYAFKHTALPMLTGTLVTVSGFIPIGFNSSSAGEYTHSLFVVIAASLLVSWIVAVLFAPLLGVKILPKTLKHHSGEPGRLMRMFTAALLGAMRWRWATILFSLAMLAVSLYSLRFVQQQFFPSSDRVELLVDMTLPQNASIGETKAQMDRLEAKFGGQDDIESWSFLRRPGHHPLLPAARPAARQRLLRPDGDRDQGRSRLASGSRRGSGKWHTTSSLGSTSSCIRSTSGRRSGGPCSTGSAVPIQRGYGRRRSRSPRSWATTPI